MKLFNTLFLLFIAFFINSCVHKVTVYTMGQEEELKIAMILPNKIGRYAHTTSTAVFAYMLTRERPYQLKTFQISSESSEEITRVLDEIKEQDFSYIIAPMTLQGARTIVEQEDELNIYFPTIHRSELTNASTNIYFGAIDYKAQIEKLTPLAKSPLVVMYDKSHKGMRLLEMTKKSYLEQNKPNKNKKILTYAIDKKRSSLKTYFNENEEIQNGSFVLNTPLIKSTMILSQLSVYDVDSTNVLSTQINYDPLLLSMIQKNDQRNLYIANSISIQDDTLVQANAVLSNDIVYDWINYASTIGADYFYHRVTGEERIYQLPFVDNQIIYPIAIVQPSKSHFTVVRNGKLP